MTSAAAMSMAIEAVCSVLIQDGVDETPVVFMVTVEVVDTVAELEVELDDPATAETTSMTGASTARAAGIGEDTAEVANDAATGAKDGC